MPSTGIDEALQEFIAHALTQEEFPLIAVTKAVAAIPWGEGRTLEEVLVTKKVGTCTGKHLLLQHCLAQLGIPTRTVTCTFKWEEQSIRLPPHIRDLLEGETWDHGHNFLQIKHHGRWVDTDVTWDPPLATQGFRVLSKDWNGTTPFIGVDPVRTRWDGVDPAVMKPQLIDALSLEMRKKRERFLDAFIAWVGTLRS
ncbi:MAG: hypothetical protein Q7R81_02580 [Candidatus Peregrinibacteria bacterium]|nr:hypothetical protein [Candidatus Peregrinibacteria bacterium]